MPEASYQVNVRFPADEYAELERLGHKYRLTLPQIIRQTVKAAAARDRRKKEAAS